MIRYQFPFGVDVFLESEDADDPAVIQYGGDSANIHLVSDVLPILYGAFGHSIGTETTPIDLSAAIASPQLARFKPQLIEGAQLIKGYRLNIPSDAKT